MVNPIVAKPCIFLVLNSIIFTQLNYDFTQLNFLKILCCLSILLGDVKITKVGVYLLQHSVHYIQIF